MVATCDAANEVLQQQATPTTTPPPPHPASPRAFTLDDKKRICQWDFDYYNRMLRLMDVVEPLQQPQPQLHHTIAPTPAPAQTQTTTTTMITTRAKAKDSYPRIFCYVNTISPHHKTHAQLVADTWAQRCDKTVFFSNDTGHFVVNNGTKHVKTFEIVKMQAPADYFHLWIKHKESLKYIYDHFRHDYDWFYKADDDAYIVVDNLRAYLKRPEIVNNYKRQPMQLGKRFNRTASSINNAMPDLALRKQWWSQWDRWVFNSGGSGYAMNRLFLDKFVSSMPHKNCLSAAVSDTQPEDTSTSFCMMWHGVVPWDTRDLQGRPRWHASSPGSVYGLTAHDARGYWYDMHLGVGGYKYGEDCCARDSIGFHYVKGAGMHHIERMLYFCRTGGDVVDIETFNDKYNQTTSHTLLDQRP